MLRTFFSRVASSFLRRRSDAEFTEELNSHIDAHAEDNVRAGMSPADARRRALVALGGMASTKDSYRDRQGLPGVEHLVRDLRFAARLLRRTPGFTATAIATLGVAIGACTAIYSIVYGVVLRPLPYPHPEQLVEITPEETMPDGRVSRATASMEDMRTWQKSDDVFSSVAGYGRVFRGRITVGDQPERIEVFQITEDYLPMHGVAPLIGMTRVWPTFKTGVFPRLFA